ncbi:MAG: hypothetical protein JWO67_1289, partial [Streptosporangiaceae bacterium]|nr:hypothetical protein [Streptosporangiaceae bacterium]
AQEAGFEALAVTATGAVGSAEHETAAAERILDAVPGLRLSLSDEIGGLGLLQREAAAVFNAALQPLAAELVTAGTDPVVRGGPGPPRPPPGPAPGRLPLRCGRSG